MHPVTLQRSTTNDALDEALDELEDRATAIIK